LSLQRLAGVANRISALATGTSRSTPVLTNHDARKYRRGSQ
jgi:hypothetical protein